MESQRLATRVSNACDRCRRQKLRCDPFRPCSNCTTSKRDCINDTVLSNPVRDRRAKRIFRSVSNNSALHDASRPPSASGPDSEGFQPRGLESSEHSPDGGRASPGGDDSSPKSPRSFRREDSLVTEFGNSTSAMDITRRFLISHGSPGSTHRATFAIPGGDFRGGLHATETYIPILELIGVELPEKSVMDGLLDVYFFTVHWFSLVVYEPTFRQRYHAITSSGLAKPTDQPFLILLLMILTLSCQYGYRSTNPEFRKNADLDHIRTTCLQTVRHHFIDLLEEDSLEFVQICALLGSYWLYWGKPRSSFAILGAAIKSAQAISLHRQVGGYQLHGNQQNIEERKRVWWTLYTWDRFATIVYGRPLGISDRDCDIPMPAVYTEHIRDLQTLEVAEIELSPYQTQLNRIYQIASPVLENIYGIRSSSSTSLSEIALTVAQINSSMRLWRSKLSSTLDLDRHSDINLQSTVPEKMHQLQALSLRLTYLNLTIIIHRSLLADWRQRQNKPQLNRSNSNQAKVNAESQLDSKSFGQCLSAALAVSRLAQSKPNLIRLAGDSHLLSFLAMNLFTSSIVLFIGALSDVLSNAAQEAKRGMSRNLSVLRSIPNAGSVSYQCSLIIKDLIQIVLQQEKDQLLHGLPDTSVNPAIPQEIPRHSNEDPDRVSLGHVDNFDAPPAARNTSQNNVPQVRDYSESFTGNIGGSIENTMVQLQRVIQDATFVHAPYRNDTVASDSTPYQQENEPTQSTASWPNIASWNTGHLLANDAYQINMNQFWLWDMDTNGDHAMNWSNSDM